MKIYTRTGDDGSTGLYGGGRAPKDDPRFEALGRIDEANAALGVVLAHLPIAAQKAKPWLDAIQSDLFAVGAALAVGENAPVSKTLLGVARVEALEKQIDLMEAELPALKNFILPQGSAAASFCHLARAIARGAERQVVAVSSTMKVEPVVLSYLNRLADFLFVLARWVNRQESGLETAWIPGPAGSASTPTQGVDRLEATLQKLEKEKESRQTLFEKASSELQKKKDQAAKAFRQSVDQINKDGGKVEKPESPFDLD